MLQFIHDRTDKNNGFGSVILQSPQWKIDCKK